jgi:hypothetical protein
MRQRRFAKGTAMNKKLSNRLATTAAALFGAAAAAGVASPALAAGNPATAAEKAPAASERIADSDAFVNFRIWSVPVGTDHLEPGDLTVAEKIADSDASANLRIWSVPAGTDSFEADDLVDEQAGTDGFTWG